MNSYDITIMKSNELPMTSPMKSEKIAGLAELLRESLALCGPRLPAALRGLPFGQGSSGRHQTSWEEHLCDSVGDGRWGMMFFFFGWETHFFCENCIYCMHIGA
jgi:hypothetical protein